MLAETLALALVLASPGSPPARDALLLQPDNAARARRGLLPRKVVRTRPPSRARRIVLGSQAPTWLGEPGELAEPAPEIAVAPAVGPSPEPIAARVEPVLAAVDDGTAALRASVDAVAVEVSLARRDAGADGAVLRATVAAPQLEVVTIRRRAIRG